MARLNLDEQERVLKIKNFYHDWGKYIIIVMGLCLAVYIGNLFWTINKDKQSRDAAILFGQFNSNIQNNSLSDANNILSQLQVHYPRSQYTELASIIAAKYFFTAKQLDAAAYDLNWAINNGTDDGIISVAMLRLADVYIDQKQFAKALQILMQKHRTEFDILFYEKRGDVHLAQGDLIKARSAYKEAINRAGGDTNMVNSIQIKLDVLGN